MTLTLPFRPAYKWVALGNTTIGALMASLDANIVVIALPSIGRDLPGMSALTLLWILLGYSLVTAVVLISFGRLSDQFGRKRLYTLGFVVFTFGSLLCGLSQTGAELVVLRMVQAVGAGLIFSNSAAILTDAFPADERGRALGINQVSVVVGLVAGLVVGGIVTTLWGWRWIFWLNLPIGVVGVVWSMLWLRESATRDTAGGIDWGGNLTFGAGMAAVVIAVTFGALGSIGATEFWGILTMGLGLLALFIAIERIVPHPMVDLSLFRIRAFTCSSIAMFLSASARGALAFVLVFYLQGPALRLSALTAGLFLVPLAGTLAVFGPLSGILSDRWGPRGLATAGLVISAFGFLTLSHVGANVSFVTLLPGLLLVGAGMGTFESPNRSAMMSAVPADRRGFAAGTGMTLAYVGTTTSVGLAVLVMRIATPLPNFEGLLLGSSDPGGSVPAGPFLLAVHLVFLLSAALLLVAALSSALRGPAPGLGAAVGSASRTAPAR
ncbi:MAG: MFS transporter [Thermoplasmata archaeon]|nr:MFS transporter [Thermoplasmata archaeon]